MSEIPEDLKYTKEHEWIKKLDSGDYSVGITHHAQDSLGDVTFVELPSVGQDLSKDEVFGVVESVKAASDLYMPLSGKVTEINEDLNNSPECVNEDPYGKGWMIKITGIEGQGFENLLNPAEYKSEIG
ncbi:MAG: glycine cleavage system protein H [Opitutae bacterium]|nr:glycine cleavage system protein H [Opitutae bacterium]|tara:strand:+ start:11351 stop:11734 length:384 start_codon:yes stop_codon:yes gene_type:complete